ncbi:MAG: hypothetical protein ABIE74_03750 [Pseudomonadota bacterium]
MAFKLGNIELDQLNPANLYNTYLGMSSKEQTYALIGVIAAVALIIILPVTMATAKLSSLRSQREGNLSYPGNRTV